MEFLNKYLSGIVLPFVLIILGLFFAVKFKFFYIFHPIKTFKTVIKDNKKGFKSLSVALAGTLGIGNIVGVASAIIMGGAGSIFWMWISAFCAMSLKYAEVVLAMKYRRKSEGKFVGGAPYYIYEGLIKKTGKKFAYFLSCIFALLCVINSLTTGNLVQINSVSSITTINPLLFGIIFTVIAFFIIIGGYSRISKITSYLIPFLTIIYVGLCLFIIFNSIDEVPHMLLSIVKDALYPKSALCGFFGYGIVSSMRFGVSRGVLSNEAGCGTSPTAHASSDNTDAHSQGCLGIFEVFVDTVLLCTLTALVILLSDERCENPTSLVLNSFKHFIGTIGSNLILVLSILFAFATVICQFFYGIESLTYISKSKKVKAIFTFIFCLVLLIGSVIPMTLMWQISDLTISLMTVFNIICLFILHKKVL